MSIFTFLTPVTLRGRPSVQWMKFAWKLLMWARLEKLDSIHSVTFEPNSFQIFKYYANFSLYYLHTPSNGKGLQRSKFEFESFDLFTDIHPNWKKPQKTHFAFTFFSTLYLLNLLEYPWINHKDSNFYAILLLSRLVLIKTPAIPGCV